MPRHAILLAAGLGTRIRDLFGVVGKQLIRVRTLELFMYPLTALWSSGADYFIVVVNPLLMDHIDKILYRYSGVLGFWYDLALNPYRDSLNGNSFIIGLKTLVKMKSVNSLFLSVSDHIFSPNMPRKLADENPGGDIAVLGDSEAFFVDRAEATKIKTVNNRVAAIGKNLSDYNYIDTGLFIINNPAKIVKLYSEDEPISLSSIIGDPRIDARTVPCNNKCIWKDVDVFIDLGGLMAPPLSDIINYYIKLISRRRTG